MASLLDALIQRQGGRFPSGPEFLNASVRERRAGGLLGPPSGPPGGRQPPSILDSGPSGGGGGRTGAGAGVQVPAAAQSGGGGGGLPANQPVQAGQGQAGQVAPGQQGAQGQPQQQSPVGFRSDEPGPGDDGLGFFGRLFVGDLTEEERRILNAEDRERLRSNALINAGLAMMGGPRQISTAQTLARGVLAARQQTRNTAGELVDERKRQRTIARLKNAIEDPSLNELEQWQQVRKILVAQGNVEALRAVNPIVEELSDLNQSELNSELRTENGRTVQFLSQGGQVVARDPYTGEVLESRPEPAETEDTFREEVMIDGEPHVVLFNAQGEMLRDLGPSTDVESGGGSGADPAVVSAMDRELEKLVGIYAERDFEPFGLAETTASGSGLTRGMTGPELQQAQAAANNVLSLIIRERSGAQATEAEVQRLASFAVPQPGDDPETVRSKLQRLRNTIRDFRGEGAVPGPTVFDAAQQGAGAGGNASGAGSGSVGGIPGLEPAGGGGEDIFSDLGGGS